MNGLKCQLAQYVVNSTQSAAETMDCDDKDEDNDNVYSFFLMNVKQRQAAADSLILRPNQPTWGRQSACSLLSFTSTVILPSHRKHRLKRAARSSCYCSTILCRAFYRVLDYSTDTGSNY